MRRLIPGLLIALLTFAVGTLFSAWINPTTTSVPVERMAGYHSPTISASPVTLTDGRDLSLYDRGGRQGCGNVLIREVPRCQASLGKARAFIWKHWQERKRGYVIVKMASEDAESDAHIFIEPDSNGAWHVVWKWERIFAASMDEDVSGRIDQIPDIRSIERTVDDGGGYFCEPGTACLLFLGADGREIQRF